MATHDSTPHSSRVAIYARVSTLDQSTDSQLLDLRRYVTDRNWQCFKEYCDNGISGTTDSRPALNELMNDARKRKFDVVLVWRFDRFARSTRHLINALEEFKNLRIDFVSYQENIDTSSPLGSAIFTIISAVAQLERDIIAERVKAGLRRAKASGRKLGRPRLRVDPEAIHGMRNQGLSYRAIARRLGVSHPTVMAALKSS
ncbi:recombinase family protein [Acidobacteria bacterium AH-259-D05]|nr:recombinase family protein [Acidobacteria bacterium AH-259-D05]